MERVADHWDEIFATKAPDEVSWFQSEPETSLRLLRRWSSTRSSLVDVGAGHSLLVDRLLDEGWSDLTLVDVSGAALSRVSDRLAARAAAVRFVACDLRDWTPVRTYRAWHDRAVFHFLTDPADRDHYVTIASGAIEPRGVLVMATFASDGPEQCSGLPTCRYEPEDLAAIFADGFTMEHAEREQHHTPSDTVQSFTWVVLRRH